MPTCQVKVLQRCGAELLLVALMLTACGGGNTPPPSNSFPFPEIPAEYRGTTVVVPPELADRVAQLRAGTSGIDWDTVDVRTLELDWRRAFIYFEYENPRARPHGFIAVTFSTSRATTDALLRDLASSWGWGYDASYSAGEQRGYYRLYSIRGSNPVETVGAAAWLADWLLRNYPTEFEYIHPYLEFKSHEQGWGENL
jgi:hypothetical protein